MSMTDEPAHIARAAAALDDPYAALSQHLHGDGETEMEHIARDIREGRFPERSERRTAPTADLTDEQIKALLALPEMYHDGEGDLCHVGGGHNLIACAALDSAPMFYELNPDHWEAIPKFQSALHQTFARALTAEAEVERLRDVLGRIACQKRSDELVTEFDVEYADIEDGYDIMIDAARAAIKEASHG